MVSKQMMITWFLWDLACEFFDNFSPLPAKALSLEIVSAQLQAEAKTALLQRKVQLAGKINFICFKQKLI